MNRFFFLLLFIFISTLPATAQQTRAARASIRGRILNQLSQPVEGATVYISDLKIGASTNDKGEYTLSNVPEGKHLIEISHISYVSFTGDIEVHGDISKDYVLLNAVVETNEVVITGVGTATQSRRAPIPIMVVRKDELQRSASTNIIEALTHKPGISSITTGPGISKPVIRGLSSNRIITMNDGIKQEGQQWGDEHGIEIDEASVNKVEIVKGPASLMYGSDALGGVINIFTNVPVAEGTTKGNVSGNYQSNNNLRSFSANLASNQKGFNWNIYTSSVRAADYENKLDRKVYNSKFRQNNYGGYIGYNSSWGYSHIIFSSFKEQLGIIEGERDDQGYFVKPVAGGTPVRATGSDFTSTMPQLPYQDVDHLKVSTDNSFRFLKSRVTFTAGYQRNKRREFADVDHPNQAGLFFDLETYNFRLQFHLPDLKNWKSSFGINGIHQINHNRGIEFLIPEYQMDDIGGYAFTQKTIKDLTISGGVRFDNRSLDSKFLSVNGATKFQEFTKTFSNVTGSVGASLKLDSFITVKANIARGFRAPSIPELASNGTHEGTNRYEYGDQNIKSETSIQLDYGLEYNSDHFSFMLNAFRNQFDNFIFYRKLSATNGGDSLVNVNGEMITAFKFDQQKANLHGFEIKLDFHPHPLDWLHFENTLSLVRGRLKKPLEGSRDLPFIPADKMISELRGDFLKDKTGLKNLYVKAELDHTFGQDKVFYAFDTETITPAYTLFNAGIGTDISGNKKQTLLSIHFIANNLTDVAWQSHLSRLKYTAVNKATGNRGVYNMGRNFSIKVNVPF